MFYIGFNGLLLNLCFVGVLLGCQALLLSMLVCCMGFGSLLLTMFAFCMGTHEWVLNACVASWFLFVVSYTMILSAFVLMVLSLASMLASAAYINGRINV